MNIYITDEEQLERAISKAVDRALDRILGTRSEQPISPDIMDLPEACDYLNKLGFKLPKSTLYKLTSTNEVPCRRLAGGRKLIFSRLELKAWFESKLEQKPLRNVSLELAKSAQRKLQYRKS